jgi:quercetin dioxygenase-like cupin family protein
MHVEIAPHAHTGLHRHFGFDAAYLLDGDLTVLERGTPPKSIHLGQSWHVRPGVVHEVKTGDRPAKVLAMYVVEKGKPLATPWQPTS